jgi:hypothetical protein
MHADARTSRSKRMIARGGGPAQESPVWSRIAPEEWRPLLTGIRPHRRPAAAFMYALAGAQRDYAASRLHRWPIPSPQRTIELRVFTLACERDKVMLFRMAYSFLASVGEPSSFTVVSDGSLSAETAAALRRLSPTISVIPAEAVLAQDWVPATIRRVATSHVLGVKLAVLMRPPDGTPCLLVDTDVEFLSGAPELASYVDRLGARPRYMRHPRFIQGVPSPSTYDSRLVRGREVLPLVNAGLILWRESLAWADALKRLRRVAEDALPLTEQTAVALALTDSHAEALPPEKFILDSDDTGSPRDRYAKSDAILRHYCSFGLQWKMNLKGGPAGMRGAPVAACVAMWRLLRSRVTGRPAWR